MNYTKEDIMFFIGSAVGIASLAFVMEIFKVIINL